MFEEIFLTFLSQSTTGVGYPVTSHDRVTGSPSFATRFELLTEALGCSKTIQTLKLLK